MYSVECGAMSAASTVEYSAMSAASPAPTHAAAPQAPDTGWRKGGAGSCVLELGVLLCARAGILVCARSCGTAGITVW